MSIRGRGIGGPPAVPDFLETDESAGGFIKNKPKMEEYLRKDGGTMTGQLDVQEPKKDSNAATKSYVDRAKETAVEDAKKYSDGKDATYTVTLTAGGWEGLRQTVAVATSTQESGKTLIIATADSGKEESYSAYAECGIRAVEQQDGKLVFQAEWQPGVDISVNVYVRKLVVG